ncbi:MAG TPA: putative Ig domain-containing protein [Phycisphaerae bacterium]|nr:putative Ig domain-containing protein [Phycisphaerae bacterium]
MARTRFFALAATFIAAFFLGNASLNAGQPPESIKDATLLPGNMSAGEFTLEVAPATARVEIAALDVASLLAEDEARPALDLPPRYAIPHRVTVGPLTHGQWHDIGAGMQRWTFEVVSPGAISINLGFTRYVMPDNGTLVVQSTDGTRRIRPFTARDNAPHGELWTPPIASDSVTIELTIPAGSIHLLDLELGSINIGYRRFGDMVAGAEPAPRSGSCNVDVACSTADAWQNEVHAVGVISTGGSTFCTGSMLNNTAQDTTPYFLTANHCGINSGNAASLVVFWNYENSVCRGIPGGGGVGDGTLTEFTTGSFFRATFSTSDFTLVELDEDPDPDFNVSFNGWSREDRFPPSGACIHHPSTDEKRISLYDIAVRPTRPSHSSSWGCSAFPGPGDGTHISVYWSLGVTEPGSSGSPLYDEFHRVIGQLHGGPSACGQTGDNLSDCYGRIWRSWTGGGTNATRLSNWLDPGNTGALFVDTLAGGGMSVSPAGPTTHVGVIGGPFTNPSVVYTLFNASPNSINYTVSLTANFGILIDGGTAPLNGTLAANGGTANVTASLGAAINSLGTGVYNETIDFTDTTNSRTLPRLHTVEVGQTGFTTTPANGLVSGGPVGGPFSATQAYTLTSTQPTAVDIQISANQPWISINGGSGPVNVNLNGSGANTAITIGYSAAANALGAGLYNGTVTFTNLNGGSGNTSRPVSLEVGRFTYAATDLPQSITDNNTITSTITVPDTYCIGDVNVELNVTHTFIGDLLITLTSPEGTTVTLHNRTGSGADNIVTTYDDTGVDPPDGPGTLANFNGTRVNGGWTLTVSDQANVDVGSVNSWALKIVSAGDACPEREVIHSVPLTTNPGWTVQGQWAFGPPLGGGSHSFDPSSGFTGANVYGYNLAGDYANNLASTQYLTTTAFNCQNITSAQLRFRRRLGIESGTLDHANIQVSNNGTSWTTVWNHTSTAISENGWSAQTYNIGAVADGQATVYIRWGMGTTNASVTYPGWNIDDVQIWGIPQCPAISVNPASLPNATAGQPYGQAISASGGTGPYTFAVTAGSLPAGLVLSSGGLLSGTPTGPIGPANFTITATDANNCTGQLAYSLTVVCATISLSPTSLASTFVDRTYTKTIIAGGGVSPYTFGLAAGTLPPGVTLSAGGVLSGTTTTAGTYNFTVMATDAAGCAGSRAYSLAVRVKVVDPF